MAKNLKFCEATKGQLESLHKDNENLHAGIVVLCWAVANYVQIVGNCLRLKFKSLKPSVAQGMLMNWKTSSRIWNSTLLLQWCLKLTS